MTQNLNTIIVVTSEL